MRIGFGYDVHRFCEGRDCVVGGVKLPYERGLLGHSDADVLCHAVTDAVLGAAALGDIGTHFPDTDEAYRGADSVGLLKKAVALVHKAGYRVVNVDATVVCERPKISPYAADMARRLAEALGVDEHDVSVKGKTEEGLGFTGSGEGIKAYAVALLETL